MEWLGDISVIVVAILGTGTASVLLTLFTARRTAGKIGMETTVMSAKLPAEVDSIVVQGAENSILIMQGVNARLVAELERKDMEIARKDAHIERLERMVDLLRDQVEQATTTAVALRKEIEAFRQDGDTGLVADI